MFSALLNRLGIADAVITADAVHAQLGALPRREIAVACTQRERGHSRTGRRTLKVTSVAKGLGLPPRPGHPDRAPQQSEREVVSRDLMRGHLADGHPSQPAAGSSRK